MLFSLGTDPEFCLESPDGQLLSAIDRVPDRPIAEELYRDGRIFPDNVLVELNIPACRGFGDFEYYFGEAVAAAARIVAPNRLVARASAVYPESELQHRKAKVFGCDPEYSAWSEPPTMVEPPKATDGLRTCGGHIHVGVEGQDVPAMIRAMDLFVGVPSVLLDNDPTSNLRQQLYGGPGRFRPKSYGFEYRTLSNFWLSSRQLARAIHHLTAMAVSNPLLSVPADVPRILETRDRRHARLLYERMIRRHLSAGVDRQIRALMETPHGDLYQNWGVA